MARGRFNPIHGVLIVLLLLTAGWSAGLNHADAEPGTIHRVGLVADPGDGTLLTRCVAFEEEEISGLAVLERSGLDLETDQGSVCAIGGAGCPSSNCWCQCQGTPCIYWTYWHWIDESWQYSQVGAASYLVHDGEVEGWRWGDGSASPASVSFEQICFPFRVYLPALMNG